jgi:hypothetical protein
MPREVERSEGQSLVMLCWYNYRDSPQLVRFHWTTRVMRERWNAWRARWSRHQYIFFFFVCRFEGTGLGYSV